ncbi:MAG: hypothetical protein FWF22_01865 [Treponema sp.]|nr:hypothetical protein [Treponema sp.]
MIIAATMLLWFGYTLFFGTGTRIYSEKSGRKTWYKTQKPPKYGLPGDPRTCPVCCAILDEGLLVKSLAFPSLNGGKDRMMYIKGCVYCLRGERERICPVCGHVLGDDEVLICRMFERRPAIFKRPHVHVLGCSRCRGK